MILSCEVIELCSNSTRLEKPRGAGGLVFACLLNVGISGVNAMANFIGVMIVLLLLPAFAADLFLLGRRVALVLAALLQCGGSHSLQKYLSLFSNNPSKKLSFEWAALSLWMVGSCVSVSFALLYPTVASSFITNNGQANLQFILSVISLGSALAVGHLAASTLLADGKIIFSGLCTLLTGPILMLMAVVLLASQKNLSGMFFVQAVFTALVAFTVITSYICHWNAQQRKETKTISQRIPEFKQAVVFGLPRAVSSSSEYMLLAVAPWSLSSVPGKASAFITATVLVRSLQMFITPVSQILGLSVAQLKSADDLISTDKKIYKSAFALWGVGVILAGIIWLGNYFFGDYIFSTMLPHIEVPYFIGFVCWAIPPSIVFYSFRNVIEMRWIFPFNLVILGFALGVQWALVQLMPHHDICFSAGLAFVLSYWLCGLGTMTALWLGTQCCGTRDSVERRESRMKDL